MAGERGESILYDDDGDDDDGRQAVLLSYARPKLCERATCAELKVSEKKQIRCNRGFARRPLTFERNCTIAHFERADASRSSPVSE